MEATQQDTARTAFDEIALAPSGEALANVRELLVLLATAKLAGQIGWEGLLSGETLESAV
ncbi:hypothetical protein PZN02_003205 [Sinorhizobium garamanticum]|uniref:Transposase n=1 Tax=Sinorhizobium garamanticum TaxID=680247 RepID=A0ABY8D7K7_9HYPH|nr:hypothetical protein [Sinorhizobium garamanticum]WEX86868.1 hypothetical protein PZN02_003205 [Sinorhizobium garamanticum]